MTCRAGLPEDPVEYAAWEKRSLDSIAEYSRGMPTAAIPELGLRMIQLSRPYTPNYEKGDRQVSHAAQAALLAIPGHAEFYRDSINEARRKMEEARSNGLLDYASSLRSKLSNEQMNGFQTLGLLPSAETVGVLGEFLNDERGYTKVPPNPTMNELEKAALERPNCTEAAKALGCLPLTYKPVPKGVRYYNTPDDVNLWRSWYEQVKAGTRTFRFEGQAQEYNLQGPVNEAKAPVTSRPDRRGSSAVAPGAEKSPSSVSIGGILAAVSLCAAGVWYFLRAKR